MDGYEDLPILLSVIQSNKVNIYCIYIKNYPGIEWRRVAFIGVFPGVRSPRMGARGEERKCQGACPKSLLSRGARLCPSPRRPAPGLCPQPREVQAAAYSSARARGARGSRAAVKTEPRSRDTRVGTGRRKFGV